MVSRNALVGEYGVYWNGAVDMDMGYMMKLADAYANAHNWGNYRWGAAGCPCRNSFR